MNKRVVYTNEAGVVRVIVPSPEWAGTIEELALKAVPYEVVGKNQDFSPVFGEQLKWRIVDEKDLPASRNWRKAWTDKEATQTVDIDLVMAKKEAKQLMLQKAKERVPADEFGAQDFTTVKKEIDALDFEAVTNLDELYNLWPASISTRKKAREYKVHTVGEIQQS